MARTEGTVDAVELNRNQSSSQALSRTRVAKRKEHHAELRSGTLRSKSGHWEQFAAAGANRGADVGLIANPVGNQSHGFHETDPRYLRGSKTSVTIVSSLMPAPAALGCWAPDLGNPYIASIVRRMLTCIMPLPSA